MTIKKELLFKINQRIQKTYEENFKNMRDIIDKNTKYETHLHQTIIINKEEITH